MRHWARLLTVLLIVSPQVLAGSIVVYNVYTGSEKILLQLIQDLNAAPPPLSQLTVINIFPALTDPTLLNTPSYPPANLQTNTTTRITCSTLASSNTGPQVIGEGSLWGPIDLLVPNVQFQSGCSNMRTQVYMEALPYNCQIPVQRRAMSTMFRELAANITYESLIFNNTLAINSLWSLDAAQAWRPPPLFQVIAPVIGSKFNNCDFITVGTAVEYVSRPTETICSSTISCLSYPTGFDCTQALSSGAMFYNASITNCRFTTTQAQCGRVFNIVVNNLRIMSTGSLVLSGNTLSASGTCNVSTLIEPTNNDTLAETTAMPTGVILHIASVLDKMSVCGPQTSAPDIVKYTDPGVFTLADCPPGKSCTVVTWLIVFAFVLVGISLLMFAYTCFMHIHKRNKLTNKELKEDATGHTDDEKSDTEEPE